MRPPTRKCRSTALTVPLAVLVILALASCTGAQPPGIATARTAGTAPSTRPLDRAQQAQQYVDCMRGQGVVMLDALTAEGIPQIDKTLSIAATVGPAMDHCKQFLPAADAAPRPSAQDLAQKQRFAACLREHGLPDYPDPDPDTGEPKMSDQLAAKLKGDPHLTSATQACQSLGPAPASSGVVGG